MTKEKMVTIHVHTPFKLTMSDNSVQEFGKGRHSVLESTATHWFTLAHSELGEGSLVDSGDQQEIIDSLQTQLVGKDTLITDLKAGLEKLQGQYDSLQTQGTEKDTLIADLKAALTQLQDQNDSLQTQLADKLMGGGGNTDGQKPKSANSK